MEVLHEKYPYRYVESGVIELNGQPDYRIQKYNTYSMRYRDMYLCDNFMQLETAMEDFEYTKWLDPSPEVTACLLYTSPSPRDRSSSRMPSSA